MCIGILVDVGGQVDQDVPLTTHWTTRAKRSGLDKVEIPKHNEPDGGSCSAEHPDFVVQPSALADEMEEVSCLFITYTISVVWGACYHCTLVSTTPCQLA